MKRAIPLLLGGLLLGSCQAPSVGRMFEDARGRLAQEEGRPRPSPKTEEKLAEHRQRVHELFDARELGDAEEHLQACFLLSTSRDTVDLELAYVLALKAVELGDRRGLPLAAEALDRALVAQGKPQHYGTQFVWEDVLQRWRQHPVDPHTTDQERADFGLPSLAELRAWEERLNAALPERPRPH